MWVFGLTVAEAADLAVAGGTALLAIATFALARSSRTQAKSAERQVVEARRMVEVAERQLIATTLPRLVLYRDDPAYWGSDGEAWIQVGNSGEPPAEIIGAQLRIGPARADGHLPGVPVTRAGPVAISFEGIGPRPSSGASWSLQVVYRGGGSGETRQLRAALLWKPNGRVQVLREQTS